jgi:hypothetical protein
MKTLRLILLITLSTLFANTLSAQTNPLAGKWKLDGILPEMHESIWKVFTEKGEFYNQRNFKDLQIRTHRGTYILKDGGILQETVATPAHPSMAHVAGQVTTIHYNLSEDNNKLILEGEATNGNTSWREAYSRVKDPLAVNSSLPEIFKKALSEARMTFNAPPGTIEVPLVENRQMHYEYAVKYQQFPVEIRYSISPMGERMKQVLARKENGKTPEELIKKENENSKVYAYAVALNVGGGVMDTTIRSNYFPPGSVKLEFGADWGTTTLVNIKNNTFGTEYKICMMVTLHRDDLADAYIFYLSDTREHLMEALTNKISKDGSFYALKFDE